MFYETRFEGRYVDQRIRKAWQTRLYRIDCLKGINTAINFQLMQINVGIF